MTLPAFATVEDLAARIPGGISDPETARAQAALDDASSLVRSEAGRTWVTEDELDEDVPDIIFTVTLSAARRAFVNPEGVRSEGLSAYNVSFGDSSLDVYLTKEEKRKVRKAAGISGLRFVPLTRGPNDVSNLVEVEGQPGYPLPVDLPEVS